MCMQRELKGKRGNRMKKSEDWNKMMMYFKTLETFSPQKSGSKKPACPDTHQMKNFYEYVGNTGLLPGTSLNSILDTCKTILKMNYLGRFKFVFLTPRKRTIIKNR